MNSHVKDALMIGGAIASVLGVAIALRSRNTVVSSDGAAVPAPSRVKLPPLFGGAPDYGSVAISAGVDSQVPGDAYVPAIGPTGEIITTPQYSTDTYYQSPTADPAGTTSPAATTGGSTDQSGTGTSPAYTSDSTTVSGSGVTGNITDAIVTDPSLLTSPTTSYTPPTYSQPSTNPDLTPTSPTTDPIANVPYTYDPYSDPAYTQTGQTGYVVDGNTYGSTTPAVGTNGDLSSGTVTDPSQLTTPTSSYTPGNTFDTSTGTTSPTTDTISPNLSTGIDPVFNSPTEP